MNTVNECQQIIHKYGRWKYVNLNPTSPTIGGLLKFHKEGAPFRPIVNWNNAPAYKLDKMLVRKIRAHILLPYTFNVENTVKLMNDLTDLPYDHNIKFASLDINNMYSNILIKEMLTTPEKLYEMNNIEGIYVQNECLTMGAPTSSIFSEIYLQGLQNTKFAELLLKHKLESYFRYVDDILIM